MYSKNIVDAISELQGDLNKFLDINVLENKKNFVCEIKDKKGDIFKGQSIDIIHDGTEIQAIQNAYANYLKKNGNLTYRQKVYGIIKNKNQKFLIIQKTNWLDTDWDFVGGGIDNGETPIEALKREIIEEIGTKNFKIVSNLNRLYQYDFPDFVIVKAIKEGKNYKGQSAKQYLVEFLGEDDEIILEEAEIKRYKWVDIDDFYKYFNFEGQIDNLNKILKTIS